ncbi:MAG: pilus assembly protein PilP [Gammaproteobacteria bacterium]|nr:pilus assembly protein PilP [Gammaproteobacteria bacterium]
MKVGNLARRDAEREAPHASLLPDVGERSMKAILIAVIFFAGCGAGEDFSELEAFIEAARVRPEGQAEPPPIWQKAETFAYRAGKRRSPFEPSAGWEATPRGRVAAPVLEGSGRYLEHCPVDRIVMVGTLARDNTRFGLVRAGGGAVHRVGPGDVLGESGGRVQSIEPLAIQLLEIVPDGAGARVERLRTISLEGSSPEHAEDREQ